MSASETGAPEIGWSFLRSGLWIGYFTLFVAFSITCVFLGNWQFDRRDEAREEIARLDRNYDAPPVALSEALPELAEFDDAADKWLTVTATGTYVGDPVLARNRPGPQGVGANIIAPFRTSDGAVLFIDRGWIQASGPEIENAFATLPAPSGGELTIVARLRASEPAITGRTASGRTVASIDLPAIAKLIDLPYPSYSAAYGMLVSETPAGAHGVLPPKPERDEGPHLSYALQWYVFILVAGVGVAYAARVEYRNLNAQSDRVRAMNAKEAARRKRRGMSDADEEDALLGV